MIPTLQDVKDEARILLGDHEVAGGQVYTDDGAGGTINLTIPCRSSYSKMFRTLAGFDNRFVEKDMHYNLPTDTSYFRPSTAGVNDFGEVITVRERSVKSSFSVSAAAAQTDAWRITTTAAHDFETGDTVIVYGIVGPSGDINDEWTISKVDATNFDLNGCLATGTYTSGGTVSSSNEDWASPMQVVDDPLNYASPQNILQVYRWVGDAFRFSPADNIRQLKIHYTMSAALPTNDADSLRFDDSLDFLAYYAAAQAALSNGEDALYSKLMLAAVGYPQEGGSGGFLGEMINLGVQSDQKLVTRPRPFRPKRNTGLLGRFTRV